MSPLKELAEYGQSFWFDYIRRSLLQSGQLDQLIQEDGLQGMTSNPAIFKKAIAGSTDYTEALQRLGAQDGITAEQAYESLALEDIRTAADQLRSVYDNSNGRDGYVSLEVSPRLANDTDKTIAEARRLWAALDRPNIMIKVPATKAGLPAIETLLAEGINVNITLLFSTIVYQQVAEAYLRAMEKRLSNGEEISSIASVASFFISRIESAVDNIISARLEGDASEQEKEKLEGIQGQTAIANAKLAYRQYKGIFSGDRWEALRQKGATTQRLLWASTSVKNPAYRDVRYIEELIGVDTVNTIPPGTMDAFRDHGQPRAGSIEEAVEEAAAVLATTEALGISMQEVTDSLLEAGVRKFVRAYDDLLSAVDSALQDASNSTVGALSRVLPKALEDELQETLQDWQDQNKVRRLWARDAWLWTGQDESSWLEWLNISSSQPDHLGDLKRISHALEGDYFQYAVLIGMGGSSMAPEVLRKTFGDFPDHPDLHVLDSTDPAQVKRTEDAVDLNSTVFLVASKSGSTLEPSILMAYFYQRLVDVVGEEMAPARFAVITDPGSNLEKWAKQNHFRHIFYGHPGIGGRYSALSNFGIVPAAAIGIDLDRFMENTTEMVEACAACVPVRDNPGVLLGSILGIAANQGRDKMTIVASPGIASLGAWLEQLVAESTGKEGKGIIPVDQENIGNAEVYGDDRIFVYVRLEDAPDKAQDLAIEALEKEGQAVLRIAVPDVYHLGQEFFRWEIAIATAGAIMGIHPFDQPDVEASKIATRALTQEFETVGSLPTEVPILEDENFVLYTDASNADALQTMAGKDATAAELIQAQVRRAESSDYVALLAYLDRNDAHQAILQETRHSIRDARHVATCVGFGPRFLHSTGQAYKGGPNSGVFLQITCDDANDLEVPGHTYSFGVVKAAQARGDFQVLVERDRRALRVHLGKDTVAGLQKLAEIIAQT